MLSDLLQLAAGLKRCWAYAEEKKVHHSVDLDSIASRLSAQVSDDTTTKQFGKLLQAFIASIQDGHARVKLVDPPSSYGFYSLPFDLRPVAGGYVAVGWSGFVSPLPLGSLVEMVDGVPIQSLVAERAQFVSSSTQLARTRLVLKHHFTFVPKSVSTVFRDANGKVQTVSCEMIPPSKELNAAKALRKQIEWRVIKDGVGYLRVPTFQPDNSTWKKTVVAERAAFLEPTFDTLRRAFTTLNDQQHLISDLRGNGGGTDMLGKYLAGRLLPPDSPYFRLETKYSPELADSYRGSSDTRRERGWGKSSTSTVRSELGETVYAGQLYVLIDAGGFSTTDNFLACLADLHPNVTFIGRPTHGGTGAPRTLITLKHSKAEIGFCTMLVKSPNGRVIEGVGTRPDIPVQWTQQNIVDGTDPDLEAALKRIAGAR